MQKKVYFLTGFPRSGNTVISTILNQNKDIAVSGHSSLTDCFFNVDLVKNKFIFNNFKNKQSLENVQKNIVLNYYNHWKQPYILDRGEWGTPYNYSIMEKFCPNEFKIIFLIRNPIDIIKSFLKLCNDFPDFYINKQYNLLDKTTLYRSESEEKIDIITNKDTLFDSCCYAYKNLKNKENVLFIKYEDFIKNPNEIINKIYSFLDIPKYKHSFNIKNQFSINNLSYDDSGLGAPMHKLHLGKIKKSNYSEIKIPNYIIEKYKNIMEEYEF